MSRNASGTYSLPAGNPVVAGTTITVSWANTTLDDIANALTDSLSRTGDGGMTVSLELADGTVSSPAWNFANETNTGMYRVSAGVVAMSILGADAMSYAADSATLIGDDAGATVGPIMHIWRNSASPAASDVIGALYFDGEDSGGTQTTYGAVYSTIVTTTDTAEDGELRFQTMQAGTLTDVLTLDEAGLATFAGGVTVTGTSTLATVDINGGAIDGTAIGVTTPAAGAFTTLSSTGTATLATVDINAGAIDGTAIGATSASTGAFTTLSASTSITGTLATAAQTNITSVGTLSALTVSGDLTVDTNTLHVDSTNNRVGVGTASPAATLDVTSATEDVVPALLVSRTSANFRDVLTLESSTTASSSWHWIEAGSDFVVRGDGNVGIGTSSPTMPLTVVGTDGEGISLGDRLLTGSRYIGTTGGGAFGGNSSYIAFTGNGVNTGNDITYKAYQSTFGGNHIFQNGSTEAMRIDSSGNLLVGTTTGSAKLTVAGGINEKQYSLTGTAISPANGTIQYKTLTANTTFTESLSDGDYVTLMINDGTGFTVTWPTMTWVGGSAPTLETTGYNIIEMWQVNGTVYGAFVGAA